VGRDEDGGGGISHVCNCGTDLDEVVERLSGGVVVFLANAENVLLKAFIEVVEDGIGGSQFEDDEGDEDKLGVRKGVFYTVGRPAEAELVR